MCTVSYVPVRDQVFITSNRDEQVSRPSALQPQRYHSEELALVYPKDAAAGGTWIAMKENGDAAVLLNGAFQAHQPDPPYRRSRGLLFLELFEQLRPVNAANRIGLDGIEPFTLVIFQDRLLYEFRWDGRHRHCRQLPAHRPHIWSSATLYDSRVVAERERWFARFLNETPVPTQQDIFRFHRTAGATDPRNSLVMERDGRYRTVSITGMQLNDDRLVMKYADLRNGTTRDLALERCTHLTSLV